MIRRSTNIVRPEHNEIPVTKPMGKTAQAIADSFATMVMERGYNAVSYADLAEKIGIRTASIHYHFPKKSDLGGIVLQQYADMAFSAVVKTDPDHPQSYREAFAAMMEPVRMITNTQGVSCLIGVLGAEHASLPDALQNGVRQFFETQEQFLTQLLEEGREAGAFEFSGSSRAMAKVIASVLQGAIIIKKARDDIGHMESVLQSLNAMIMP